MTSNRLETERSVELGDLQEGLVKLFGIRRPMCQPDAISLRTRVKEELEGQKGVSSVGIFKNFGFTYASKTVLRRIYRETVRTTGDNGSEVVARFNSITKEHQERFNGAGLTFAKLGEVGVYGRRSGNGKRFIGAAVDEGFTDDRVCGESKDLLKGLIPAQRPDLLSIYLDNHVQHMSFGISMQPEEAERATYILNESGVVRGQYVQLGWAGLKTFLCKP